MNILEKNSKFVNSSLALWGWVRIYQKDIVLVFGVVLISLISFAAGYLVAKDQLKTPLYIESPQQEQEETVL